MSIDDMKPYTVFMIAQSYARVTQNQEHYMDLAPRLIEILNKEPETLDQLLYVNQWLTLA